MRRSREGGSWIFVVLAALVTFSPEPLRRQARERLLDAFAQLARVLAPPAQAAALGPEDPEIDDAVAQELGRLRAENSRLKDALARAGAVPEALRGATNVALVPVEASPLTGGSSIQRRLLLSAGRNLGIAAGQPAVLGTALVGIIVQAGARSAELRLVLDPAFRIRAQVQGRELEGLVRGRSGERLCFELIAEEGASHEIKLAPGEVVVSAPKSSLCAFPVVLGRISKVERFGALTRAEVIPAIDGRALDSVVVIRPRQEG